MSIEFDMNSATLDLDTSFYLENLVTLTENCNDLGGVSLTYAVSINTNMVVSPSAFITPSVIGD